MNGPNPVCTSATQNANQSRARWLRREAAIGGSGGSTRGGGGGAASRPPGRLDWRRWRGAGALGRGYLSGAAASLDGAARSGLAELTTTTGSPRLYSGARRTWLRV